jgi:ATP:corrinoid adenosyltransferase
MKLAYDLVCLDEFKMTLVCGCVDLETVNKDPALYKDRYAPIGKNLVATGLKNSDSKIFTKEGVKVVSKEKEPS